MDHDDISSDPTTLDGDPWARLADYFAGSCTADEQAAMERWIHADPQRAADIVQLRAKWATQADWRQPIDSTAAWMVFLDRSRVVRPASQDERSLSAESPRLSRSVERRGTPIRSSGQFLRMGKDSSLRKLPIAVAGVAAIVFLGITTRWITRPPVSPDMVRTYSTRPGQRAEVMLLDGSQVTLAPATRLRAVMSSRTQTVTITVDGEALFRVIHRSQAPFIVHTRNAITRVLGTQFLVRQYRTDPVTRVVVADGRVSFHSTHDSTANGAVMTARMMALANDSGRVEVSSGIPVEDYTAWTSGQLVFRKTPVRVVVADLSRAYGANIQVSDSALARYTVTWSVPTTQISLAGALDALTAVLKAHVVQTGTRILVTPGRSTSVRPSRVDSLSRQEHGYGR